MTSAFAGLPMESVGSLCVICVAGAAAAGESGRFDLVESHVHDYTWKDVDGHTLNLADAETGPRRVFLNAPARAILER